ncbi:hypothetical protein [Microscilla marina]|uniref:Uncharacterized protein n=1 Tax=Microscilla marina ATCC 23134 TaxID=313606 RepID=A1ZG39_MICM2|nr:hypothetical protein [Microscilla marina]EAY30456.1 hypothetical protein M23134_03092 [Microscilla marina ATCC 23134]
MFLPNSDNLRYYPPDLINAYLSVFFRRHLFGLKVFSHYDQHWDYFILRTRYVLAAIPDEHIEALFKFSKQDVTTNLWAPYQREALLTACWVAGLLKKRQFLPQVKEAILTANDHIFFSPAWLSALFLYNDESLIPTLQTYINQYIEPQYYNYRNAATQAVYALRLWDNQHQTNYAKAYSQYDMHLRIKTNLDQVLRVSEIIRANIDFTYSWQLQQRLKTLLDETTTPSDYCHGLLTSPIIRTYAEGQQAHVSWWWNLEKRKAQYLTGQTADIPDKESLEHHPQALVFRTSHRFESFVRQYIQRPQRAAYLPELIKETLLSQDPIDLLAALEIDITYCLPREVIEICYQKLFEYLPHSIALYESYALALLMRGNSHDQKAAVMYEKAQAMKAKYIWDESAWGGWAHNPVRYK